MSNIYITFLAVVFVRETVVTRLAEKRRACREGYDVNIKMNELPFWGSPDESLLFTKIYTLYFFRIHWNVVRNVQLLISIEESDRSHSKFQI